MLSVLLVACRTNLLLLNTTGECDRSMAAAARIDFKYNGSHFWCIDALQALL